MQDRPDLNDWFGSLSNVRGNLCCSYTDGVAIAVDDWDSQGSTENSNSGYRVRLDGQWFDVPKYALIEKPNRYGPALAWPAYDWMSGEAKGPIVGVRCFLPGAGA